MEKLFKKNRAFYASVACTVVDGLLSGCNFLLIYLVLDSVFARCFSMSFALELTAALAAVFVARLAIFSFGYVQGQVGGARVSRAIRLSLGDRIKRIPLSCFTERTSGDYLNALTVNVNDYEQILTHKTGSIVKNITLAIMLTCFVFWLYAPAGLVVAVMFLLDIPGLAYAWSRVRTFGVKKSAVQASNTSAVVEHVEGMQTLRAYGVGGVANTRIVESMRTFSDISYRYEAAVTLPAALVSVLIGCGQPVLFVLCASAVLSGELDVVAALLIVMLPLFVVKLSGALFIDLTAYRNLSIARARISAVAEQPQEEGDLCAFPAYRDVELAENGVGIELSSVSFSYEEGVPVLSDFNLVCAPGKLTALVGESGCGKSTVLNLIAQYYRPSAGLVRIGGVDTCGYAPESVLAGVSIVDQNTFLFNDSVLDNVRYARPGAADEDVVRACQLAHADAFASALPQGYDTLIGENGDKLSGGERQRLSIARAILRDAPIVLLDEATSSLDIENELAVKGAIQNLLMARKTVVMVAHTLPIVRSADVVAVVAEGHVCELGTHEELLEAGGRYARMWQADRQLV